LAVYHRRDAAPAESRKTLLGYIDENVVASPPPYFLWGGPHRGRTASLADAVPKPATVHDLSKMRVEYVEPLGHGGKCIALVHLPLVDL
jgi:hypothetical protein